MLSRCCEFVDSRLRRSPPDRASAVPYGQAGENAMRFPRLAHRSAAAHKLHSTPQQHRMNLISGNDQTSSRLPAFSLLLPESCPNNRDRGSGDLSLAKKYLDQAHSLEPHNRSIQHSLAGLSRRQALETTNRLLRQRHRDRARALVMPLLGATAESAYGYHT